jgi:hypothetical protein
LRLDSGRGERCEVDGGIVAAEDLSEEQGGGWSQQDPVTEVTGGEIVVCAAWQQTQKGETIRSGRAKASPGFKDGGRGEDRQEVGDGGEESGNVRWMDGLVESLIFDGGSDDGSSGVRT